jgi:hypothetical protein
VRRGVGDAHDLPFAPVDCHEEAQTARDACRAILAIIE